MEERKNHHRGNRKWLERCLAYLLAFAITLTSVPMNTVFADTDSTPSTQTETGTETTESTDTDIALDTETSTEADTSQVGVINETEGGELSTEWNDWDVSLNVAQNHKFDFAPRNHNFGTSSETVNKVTFGDFELYVRGAGYTYNRDYTNFTLSKDGEIPITSMDHGANLDNYSSDYQIAAWELRGIASGYEVSFETWGLGATDDSQPSYEGFRQNDFFMVPAGKYELTLFISRRTNDADKKTAIGAVTRKINVVPRVYENYVIFNTGQGPDGNKVPKRLPGVDRNLFKYTGWSIKTSASLSADKDGKDGNALLAYLGGSAEVDLDSAYPNKYKEEVGSYKTQFEITDVRTGGFLKDCFKVTNPVVSWDIVDGLDDVDDKDVPYIEQILIEGCTADGSGTYWVTEEKEITIKPKYGEYYGTQISLDGTTWSDSLEVFVSAPTTINYYLKCDAYSDLITSTFPQQLSVSIDKVPPSATLKYKGVSFDGIFSEEYTNKFFAKMTDDSSKITASYAIPKKESGSPITAISWTIVDAAVDPTTSADVFWQKKEISDADYVQDSVTGKYGLSGDITFTKDEIKSTYDKNETQNVYGSKVIWFKLTDGSGKDTYISTDNIIVYEDLKSTYDATNGNATYVKADSASTIKLFFDNALADFPGDYTKATYIDAIYIKTSLADGTLVEDYRKLNTSDYGVIYDSSSAKDCIVLYNSSFPNVKVNYVYDVRVDLKPYGFSYVGQYETGAQANDAPNANPQFCIKVGQAEGWLEMNALATKVYDGTPYKDYSPKSKSEGGTIKVYFQSHNENYGLTYESYPANLWSETAPVNAGRYVMKAVLEYGEGAIYTNAVDYVDFRITPRPVSATVEIKPVKTFDGTTEAEVIGVTVDTTLTTKKLKINPSLVKAKFENCHVGDNKTVIVTGVEIPENGNVYPGGEQGNLDFYENYQIINWFSTLASIEPATVTITLNPESADKENDIPLPYTYGTSTTQPNKHIADIVKYNGVTVEGIVIAEDAVDANNNPITELADAEAAVLATLNYNTTATYKSNKGEYAITAISSNTTYAQDYKFVVETPFTIVAREAAITWNYVPEVVYKAEEYEVNATVAPAYVGDQVDVTYTTTMLKNVVKNTDGTYSYEKTDKVTATNVATDIGYYLTELALTNQNYTTNEYVIWEIKEFAPKETAVTPTVANGVYPNTNGSDVRGWYNSGTITISAPEGFSIAKDANLSWRSSFDVKNLSDGIHTITYYLKEDGTDYVTNVRTLQVAIDKTPANATLTLHDEEGSFVQEVLDKILGYLFAKKTLSFTVDFTDNFTEDDENPIPYSGVAKVQYDYVLETNTDESTYKWKNVTLESGKTETVLVDAAKPGVNVPYCLVLRITDKAGNVSLLNSAGIYIYEDATYTGTGITYNKMSSDTSTVFVDFKTNAVKGISIYGTNENGEKVLVETLANADQYVVGTNAITFYQSAFDGLPTKAGEKYSTYEIRVSFDPLGKNVTENYDLAREPKEVIIPLQVGKATATLTVESYKKAYDGQPVQNLVYHTNSTGDKSFKYYKGTSSFNSLTNVTTYTNTGVEVKDANGNSMVPKDAGIYYVEVTVAADDTYNKITSSATLVIIEKKSVNAYIDIKSKTYDGNKKAVVEDIRIETGVETATGAMETFAYASGLDGVLEFIKKDVDTDILVECIDTYNNFNNIQYTSPTNSKISNYDITYHLSRANIIKKDLKVTISELHTIYDESVVIEDIIAESSGSTTTGSQLQIEGLVIGENLNEALSISYNSSERKHVLYDENGNLDGYQLTLNDLTYYSRNYNVVLNGNPKLYVHPKETNVNWKVTDANDKVSDLKDPSRTTVINSSGNRVTKILQNDTVIYNGFKYVVDIKDLGGILPNDTVISGKATGGNYKYEGTKVGTYVVGALDLNSNLLVPKPSPNPAEADSNQNLDYVLPEDTKDDTASNKTHTWYIKYLDDYYRGDQVEDSNDKYTSLNYNGSQRDYSVRASETGFNRNAELYWLNTAEVIVKPGTYGSTIMVFANDVTDHPAPDETTGIVTYTGTWETDIEFDKEGQNVLVYAIKNSEGYITSVRKTLVNIDTTKPEGTITVKKADNSTKSFTEKVWDAITSIFFGKKVTVEITGRDDDWTTEFGETIKASDLRAVEYKIAEKGDTVTVGTNDVTIKKPNGATVSWTPYNSTFEISENKVVTVFARITDNAGNVTIINSDKLVVYEDEMSSEVKSTEVEDGTFVVRRKDLADVTVEAVTKGYDVESVSCQLVVENSDEVSSEVLTTDDYVITSKTAATEASNTTESPDTEITIKKDYLAGLEIGTYQFTVKYKPLGESWDDDWAKGFNNGGHGDKPTETVFKIKIMKSKGNVVIDPTYASYKDENNEEVITNVYNGKGVAYPDFTTVNTKGSITEFSNTKDETTGEYINYSSTKPVDAGTYSVRVTVFEDDNYEEADAELEFEIAPAPIELKLPIATKIYNGTTSAALDTSRLGVAQTTGIGSDALKVTLPEGSTVTCNFKDANVGVNKEVVFGEGELTVSAADADSATKKENYVITYVADNAEIKARPITVTMNAVSVEYGDEIPTSFGYDEITDSVFVADKAQFGTLAFKTTAAQGNIPTSYDIVLDEEKTVKGEKYGNYAIKVDGTGKFTIAKRIVDIDWVNSGSEADLQTSFVYDGLEHNVTPVITNPYDKDDISLVYEGSTAVRANENGTKYVSKVTELAGKANAYYALPTNAEGKVDTTLTQKEWTIVYASDLEDKVATLSPSKEWYNAADKKVTIVAPTNYSIAQSDAANAAWASSFTYEENSADANGTVITYYLKNSTGAISKAKTVTVKVDKELPGGKIQIRENIFDKILETITFGYFFKVSELDVTITGTDEISGIASITYKYDDVTVTKTYDNLESAVAEFKIPIGKKVVTATITDKAGNSITINSDGLVVYVDSQITTTGPLTYTKATNADVEIQTALYGNTVKSVTVGRTVLNANEYTVQDDATEANYGKITISNTFLQTLEEGTYNVVIAYNPQGETFTGAQADALVDTTIALNVVKNTNAKITVDASTLTKVYDGTPISVGVTSSSTATPKFEYATVVDGVTGTYSATAPTNVGTYAVKIKVPADSNYIENEVVKTVTIKPRAVKVDVEEKEVVYGNEIGNFDFTVNSSTPLPTGKDKEDLRLTLGVVNAVNAGDYDVVITGMDNANYSVELLYAENALRIEARPIIVDWGTTAFVYTAKTHKVVPTITNLVSGDTCNVTFTENSVTSAKAVKSNYYAEIEAVDNDNYTVTGATGLTCNWSISYSADDADAVATISPAITDEWYTTNVTLTAPEGYVIATQNTNPIAGWNTELTVSAEGTQTVTYYLQNTETGAITDATTVTIKIDKTAPTGTIKIAANEFKEFINNITFGLFFKNTVDVTITGVDTFSGIATYEYQMVEKEAGYDENGTWTEAEDGIFSISANKKVIVYAKITDKAGHSTIINSKGVVVYTDVAQKIFTAEPYTRTTKDDVVVDVTEVLNGNTIKAVSYNGEELPADKYGVNGGKITLDGEYLEEKFAVGTYTFKVSYNPFGVTTTEAVDISLTDIVLKVVKQTLSEDDEPTITLDPNTVYDRSPVEVSAAKASDCPSTGDVKVYYKPVDASDDAYTVDAPTDAGSYVVKAVVEADENYEAIEATAEFTINPRPVDAVVWPEVNSFIYNEQPHTVAATIEGIIEGDTITVSYTGVVSATEEGEYTATVAGLGNSNYTLEGVDNKTFNWIIKLDIASGEDLKIESDSEPTDDGWYGDSVTIKAPEGTKIRVQNPDGSDEWLDEVVIDKDGENKVVFEIKDLETGFVSETEEMTFPIDKNDPKVTVTIAGKEYTEDAEDTDPSVFVKDKIVIDVKGSDATSDVKVSYMVLPEDTEFDENGTWTDAETTDNKITIDAPAKATVYVKVTDEAGNETIIETTDIIVYKDAQAKTDAIEFTKASENEITAEVELNGNEIGTIKIGETVLDSDDYTVDENGIISFEPECLDQFPAGTYDVTITYKPCGEAYEEAEGNVPPATTSMTLVIEKADSIVNETELTKEDFEKYYDGKEVAKPELEQNDKGQEIVYEYKVKGADDSTYTTAAPTEVGEYTVRITAKENAYYDESVVTIDFAIAAKAVTVDVGTITVTANKAIIVNVDDVVVTGIAEGHSVQSIKATGTTTTVTENGTYTLSDLVIVDANGKDVTANYAITYNTGRLIVEHDTTLPPAGIEVDMETEYTANDVLNKSDIEVTISYADGYTKKVTVYDSNIGDIDMTQIGTKTVVISYTENGRTVEETVSIHVAHNPESNYTVEVILPSYEFELSEDMTAENIKDIIEDGIGIEVSYEDGYEPEEVEYTTNVADIDWSTPGVKTLKVIYEDKTVEILIVVKEKSDEDEGAGKVEVIPGVGAPETNIENTNTEELKEELLTPEEKVEVEAGEDYKIYLEVKDIENEVSEEHKTEVAEAMTEGQKLGAYIDISLYTKVGDKEASKITESDVPLEITIVIPEELRAPEGKVRTYKIVRVHELGNGQDPETTVIDLDAVDGEAYTYSFATDRFSTYAIIYTESNASGGNNGGGSGSGSGSNSSSDSGSSSDDDVSTGSTGTEVPKTGDEATPFVWSFALLAAMSALSVCVKRLSKKRR